MAGPSDSTKPPISSNPDQGIHMRFIAEDIANDKQGIKRFGVFSPIREIKKSEGELQVQDSNITSQKPSKK